MTQDAHWADRFLDRTRAGRAFGSVAPPGLDLIIALEKNVVSKVN
jgi:hypothetical protein